MGYFWIQMQNMKTHSHLESEKTRFILAGSRHLKQAYCATRMGCRKRAGIKGRETSGSWRASDRTPRASRRPQYACNARPAPARAMPPSMASLRCKHPARFSLQRKTQERKIPVRSEREILSEASVAVQNFRFHQQKAQQGGLLGFFTNGKPGRGLPELFS